MANERLVKTKFWTDNYVLDELNPIDKLLFLYLITNPYTNISGVYELSLKIMAVETGIDKENIEKVILPRFEKDGKIFYRNGWICIKNFVKNQNQGSPKVKEGIKREIMAVPKDILEEFVNLGYGIDTLSYLTKLNLTKLNLTEKEEEVKYQEIDDDGNPIIKRKGIKKKVIERTDEFSNEKALAECMNSPLKVKKIVGLYFKYRNWEFENWGQFETALAREIKTAVELKNYKGQQIIKAMDYCKENWQENWTLETVVKWIHNVK